MWLFYWEWQNGWKALSDHRTPNVCLQRSQKCIKMSPSGASGAVLTEEMQSICVVCCLYWLLTARIVLCSPSSPNNKGLACTIYHVMCNHKSFSPYLLLFLVSKNKKKTHFYCFILWKTSTYMQVLIFFNSYQLCPLKCIKEVWFNQCAWNDFIV